VTVRNVPEYVKRRQALLPLAHKYVLRTCTILCYESKCAAGEIIRFDIRPSMIVRLLVIAQVCFAA